MTEERMVDIRTMAGSQPVPGPVVLGLLDQLALMTTDRNAWRKKAEDRRRWGRRDVEQLQKRKTKEKLRADAAEAKLTAIDERHQQGSLHIMDMGKICQGCGRMWPCPERRILDGASA